MWHVEALYLRLACVTAHAVRVCKRFAFVLGCFSVVGEGHEYSADRLIKLASCHLASKVRVRQGVNAYCTERCAVQRFKIGSAELGGTKDVLAKGTQSELPNTTVPTLILRNGLK